METRTDNMEMYDLIRENRLAMYSKPRRYFNRDGSKGSAFKFLFLVEVIVFMILVFAATTVNAQQVAGNSMLQTEHTFNSSISNYTTVYNSGKVFLNWSAMNEQADCIYIVERSSNGTEFDAVGVREGIGTSVELFYSWIDNEPPAGFSYYRIKKITKDGTQFFSATNSVINQGSSFNSLDNQARKPEDVGEDK
jgi:hypothetical protein